MEGSNILLKKLPISVQFFINSLTVICEGSLEETKMLIKPALVIFTSHIRFGVFVFYKAVAGNP